MEQKTETLCPSAPLENSDLEQRLEKKLNDVKSFINDININREMITYFEDKNNKSKKKFKKCKTKTTILKSFDTFVIIVTTSSSLTISLTGIGLISIPISTATACELSIGIEVIYEIINKNNKYKKQFEKDQKTIKSFDKLYRKSSQDNVIDKNEYNRLCNFSTKYLDETKIESFL